MDEFNIEAELSALKQQTMTLRKTRFHASRLDRYQGPLLTLYQAGATCAELQRFLRKKRIKVAHSTVARWLIKHGR